MKPQPLSVRLKELLLFLLLIVADNGNAQQSGYTEPEGPLSKRVCMTCHGAYGQGSEVVGGPNLAGMEPWYLRRQLQAFRSRWRGTRKDYIPGYEMREAVQHLGEDEIEELVALITAWPAVAAPATLSGDAARGQTLYQTCAACHGPGAEGNEALGAPALAARNDWYLLRQLKLFKSGYRGGHPEDDSGARMRAMTSTLADEADMLDVLAYINTLN